METIWILGGGEVGIRAFGQLKQSSPNATIVIVDKQPNLNLPVHVEFICEDGVEWLTREFTTDSCVSKIIPALPLHLVSEWVKRKLFEQNVLSHPVEIPADLLQTLPHPIRLSASQLAVSHADFLCPTNCPEPNKICSYTKSQRPPALFDLLRTMDWQTFTPFILRSRQFAPGLGGFFPDDLWNLLRDVKQHPNTSLLIGTACKCHGIIDGFYHTAACHDS